MFLPLLVPLDRGAGNVADALVCLAAEPVFHDVDFRTGLLYVADWLAHTRRVDAGGGLYPGRGKATHPSLPIAEGA